MATVDQVKTMPTIDKQSLLSSSDQSNSTLSAGPYHEASPQELDTMLARLHSNKDAWAQAPSLEKISILREIVSNLGSVDWKSLAQQALLVQGIDPSVHGNNRVKKGESPARDDAELLTGVEMVVNTTSIVGQCNKLIEVLSAIDSQGEFVIPDVQKDTAQGPRTVKQVFPMGGTMDAKGPLGAAGWTGEVWIQHGQSATVGAVHAECKSSGQVAVVLGAGNQGVLAITDMMHMMFHEHCVCIVKHHELRSYNQPFFAAVFAPLISRGYLADVCGGVRVGVHLTNSSLVDRVHMTGGTATHDLIVWGPSSVQQSNKDANTPVLEKPMSSELGCITPWIVTPAVWSEEELWHHAKQLAAAFTSNNSCNCLSPKVVVMAEGWPQEASFLDKLRKIISSKPALPAYYPGTEQRYQGFLDAYQQRATLNNLDNLGDSIEGKHEVLVCAREAGKSEHVRGMKRLSPLFVHCTRYDDIVSGAAVDYALNNEAFGPVLAFMRIPADAAQESDNSSALNSQVDFLKKATDFCNDHVWGTLSCTILAHPTVPAFAVEDAIATLRYGAIGVNTWTARCFGVESLPWGAYPGEQLNNVQSGIGFVRNAYGVDNPEKGVLRSPFICNEHLGCDPKPMTIWRASTVCRFVTQGGLGALLNMICFPGCMCWCRDPSGVSSSDYRNGD